MATLDPRLPALPCPECMERARSRTSKKVYPGRYRIGNQRERCRTCNNFSQAVMRLTRSRLMKQFSAEYQRIRITVEHDLYPQVIQDYERAHPWVGLADPTSTVEVPVDQSVPLAPRTVPGGLDPQRGNGYVSESAPHMHRVPTETYAYTEDEDVLG